MPGSLLAGPALEIAQDDQRPEPLGQSSQFLVQPREQCLVTGVGHGGFGQFVHLHLTPAPLRGRGPQPDRRLLGDAVEPVRHHLPGHNGRRLLDKHQERGLKRIFRIVRVADQSAANAPHHWSMAPHQGGERVFVTAVQEPSQKFPVSRPDPVPPGGDAELPDDLFQRVTWHSLAPRRTLRVNTILRQGAN